MHKSIYHHFIYNSRDKWKKPKYPQLETMVYLI